MRLLIIAAASLAVVSCASLSLEDLEFHAWKLKFEKSYSSLEEEAHRKNIWISTRLRVLDHNILADQGIKTYRMGMNQFSDMVGGSSCHRVTHDRISRCVQYGTISSKPKGGAAKLPDSLNWRDNDCVTPVKDMGLWCSSSWAFSMTGALESHTCINYGHLPSLSEQQLVDCSGSYGNKGCDGGRIDPSFQYVIDNRGIDTEAYYPYEGKDGSCRFNPSGVGATCSGYSDVTPSGDESALQWFVANMGPVSVTIDVGSLFLFYESGVFSDPDCSSSKYHAAFLVVGYGTEGGRDYWLVKSSLGVFWGEEGYIKMSRNQGNQCGSVRLMPLILQSDGELVTSTV
ncbi:procathepsin L-like [Clupea harengus]|uniref:Procathepsin L-like n=1 Tax=Clupea harengus TaxID=7950 RepID=A0A6P8GAT2_CLUHA|nr:procathepsin L-like [Clupea harengus]